MGFKLTRREFIHTALASTAGIYLAPFFGCGKEEHPDELFPQGIASGDPKPDSVILWTRVLPRDPSLPEEVRYELSLDEGFTRIVARGRVLALPEYDHTVRVKVIGLVPFTRYFYRFFARKGVSRTGRTLTAPTPEMEVPVRFAFASCQDYVGRYYHAWKLLADEEERSGEIHFVLFLGDYIYEYETGSDVTLSRPERRRVEIPDGLEIGGIKTAWTLNDYRALYKRYKSDENLKRAHELYPFIVMWDDHDFANDCWQDHANDFNGLFGDEKEPERRRSATRAFFEYLPVDADYHPEREFPRDLTLYRSLRFGSLVEIFLTDQRYYRSDHVIREDEIAPAVGKLFPFSPLGSRVFAVKEGFDRREAGSGATMLGKPQLEWLIQGIRNSSAVWKFLASPLVMMQMLLDLRGFESLPPYLKKVFYFKLDQWDGYRTERKQLLSSIRGIENVVVLSGDLHGFYAGELYEDFDNPSEPVAVEFAVAGISSSPVREQVERIVESQRILKKDLAPLLPFFDANILQSNPHIRYASGTCYGVGIVEVKGREEIQVTFLRIEDVTDEAPTPQPSYISFRVERGKRIINPLAPEVQNR